MTRDQADGYKVRASERGYDSYVVEVNPETDHGWGLRIWRSGCAPVLLLTPEEATDKFGALDPPPQ